MGNEIFGGYANGTGVTVNGIGAATIADNIIGSTLRTRSEAEKAEGMAQTQYKNGLVDFLNVVTAQGTLAASQQELVLSEQTLLVDLIAVYKALGGGWDVFEERAADLEQQPSNTELPR